MMLLQANVNSSSSGRVPVLSPPTSPISMADSQGDSRDSKYGGEYSDAETEPYFGSDDESNQPEALSGDEEQKSGDTNSKKRKNPPPADKNGRKAGRIGKSKEWFLTYPQCETDPQVALTRITNRWDDIVYAVVAREEHKDGRNHLHCFIQFKDVHGFHYKGGLDKIGGKHGNYQIVKTRIKCRKYVCKGGNYVEYGEFTCGDVYADALSKPSYDLSMSHIKTHKPRDYVIYHTQISATFQKEKPLPNAIYSVPKNYRPFNPPADLLQWMNEEANQDSRAKCLVLIGDSRLGKTSWARASFPNHMYFRGHFSLKAWKPDAKILIFDDCSDISEKNFTFRKAVLTQMGQATLTDKYCQKVDVNVSMPAIILANSIDELPWLNDEKEKKYWEQNCTFIELTERLY